MDTAAEIRKRIEDAIDALAETRGVEVAHAVGSLRLAAAKTFMLEGGAGPHLEHSPGCAEAGPEDAECTKCGADACPHGEPMHWHHDGCPSCSLDDARRAENPKGRVVVELQTLADLTRVSMDAEQARDKAAARVAELESELEEARAERDDAVDKRLAEVPEAQLASASMRRVASLIGASATEGVVARAKDIAEDNRKLRARLNDAADDVRRLECERERVEAKLAELQRVGRESIRTVESLAAQLDEANALAWRRKNELAAAERAIADAEAEVTRATEDAERLRADRADFEQRIRDILGGPKGRGILDLLRDVADELRAFVYGPPDELRAFAYGPPDEK